jgi:hypothetical protein
MENDKKFFLYGILSVIIFIIFIFSFKICKAEQNLIETFEESATGTSASDYEIALFGDNYWQVSDGYISDTYAFLGSQSLKYSGVTISNRLNEYFTERSTTTSITTFTFYQYFKSNAGFDTTDFFFGITGISFDLEWDLSESHFDLKDFNQAYTIYDDLVPANEWVEFSGSINCQTGIFNFEINTSENDYSTTTAVICGDLLYYYINKNYPGDVYVDNFVFNNLEDFFDVEIIELPDYSGNIQIGSETKLQYNRYNTCYINKPCYFKINYGYDEIGSDLVFYYFDTATMIDFTTLPDSTYLTHTFSVPIETDETLRTHCLILDNGTTTPEYFCDITINWLSFPECSEENMCEDIATSSDFLYGVQCGARQTVCWLFNPSDTSIQFLQNNVQNMENSFPFNLAFGLINEVSDTMETSTSTGVDLGLPSVIDNEYVIVNGISSSSFSEVFGTSTTYMIEDYATYIIWLLVAVGVSIIIIKYAIL